MPNPTPTFIASDARRFLDLTGVPVALTSFNAPADDRQSPHATRVFNSIAEAVTWARQENLAGRNVYVTPNVVKPSFVGKKPGKADILASRYAWADADPDVKAAGGYAEAHERVQREATARARELGASVIVSTGNGVQAFIRYDAPRYFHHPDHSREELIETFEGLTARFARALDGTAKVDAVQNIDRLMRLPGTVNYADATKLARGYPRLSQSRIIELTGRKWTVAEVREALPEVEKMKKAAKPAGTAERFEEDTTPLDEAEAAAVMEQFYVRRNVDVFLAARWAGRGLGLGDDSRSGLDMSLGAMLKLRGFSYREMRHIIIECPHGAGADRAGDDRYFQRIWQRSGATGVTLQEVKDEITGLVIDAMPEPPATDAWARIMYDAHLGPQDREAVLNHLVELKVGKKAPLKAEWREYEAGASAAYQRARAKVRTTLVARTRRQIAWNQLDYNGMLPEIERAMLEDTSAPALLRVDHTYVRVVTDEIPGTTHPDNNHLPDGEKLPAPQQVHLSPLTRTAMLLRIEKSVCLYAKGEKGIEAIEVPVRLPEMMLDLPDKRAPRVKGLVQHPVITPTGRLVAAEGFDPETGLFLAFGGWRFPEVPANPTQEDAKAAAQRIRDLLLAETMLKDEKVDGTAVIAALLTGLARKVLPQAPGVLINATTQGTGKTTLARQIHAVLTGRDAAVQTISPDSGEFQKAILATLLGSPAMVLFDNLADGSTIDNPQLAGVLTSPTFKNRMLGASEEVTVPTNTLWVFTGNSITAGSDSIRRMIKVDLLAKEKNPEQHRYTHADPVHRAQEVRSEVLKALLTMQRASLLAGGGGEDQDQGNIYGFGPAFDRLVTRPLAYAGQKGLFDKRKELADQSPVEQANTAALVALAAVFGVGTEFTTAACIDRMTSPLAETPDAALRIAIEATDRKGAVRSAASLGKFFNIVKDQPPREELVLRGRTLHGSSIYWIEKVVGG